MIFDIQRFSTHDGPGIRTVVFFKGCPLRCAWCENPESQSPKPELLYTIKDCIGCHACLRVDNGGALRARAEGGIEVLREATPPLSLAGLCPSKALRIAGREASVPEILAEVRKDRSFYDKSGGGLTLSGGEPLAQIDFAEELLKAALDEGIDIAVESCLAVGPRAVERLGDLPIHWLTDLKQVDPLRFREGTGGDVEPPLANLRYLAGKGADLTVRVPLVPGFNDDLPSVRALFDFVLGLAPPPGPGARRRVDLLPYHDLAAGKYAALGRSYPYRLGLRLDPSFPEACARMGRSLGLEIAIGG
jgi:pyruvate formate lyase activating enzyme